MESMHDINMHAFKQLQLLFGDNFAKQYESFVANTHRYLDTLEELLHAQEYEQLKAQAHMLFSSTALYGATRLSAMARELEYSNSSASTEMLEHKIVQMRIEFNIYKRIISTTIA